MRGSGEDDACNMNGPQPLWVRPTGRTSQNKRSVQSTDLSHSPERQSTIPHGMRGMRAGRVPCGQERGTALPYRRSEAERREALSGSKISPMEHPI